MPVKHQRLYHILIKIGLPLKSILRNDRLQYMPEVDLNSPNVWLVDNYCHLVIVNIFRN